MYVNIRSFWEKGKVVETYDYLINSKFNSVTILKFWFYNFTSMYKIDRIASIKSASIHYAQATS